MQYSNLSSDKASAILQIIEGFNKSNSDKQTSNGDLKRYGAELTYTLSKNEDDRNACRNTILEQIKQRLMYNFEEYSREFENLGMSLTIEIK